MAARMSSASAGCRAIGHQELGHALGQQPLIAQDGALEEPHPAGLPHILHRTLRPAGQRLAQGRPETGARQRHRPDVARAGDLLDGAPATTLAAVQGGLQPRRGLRRPILRERGGGRDHDGQGRGA